MSSNLSSKKLSPLQAIRSFCLECEGDSYANVKACLNPSCSFHYYRLGSLPDGHQHSPLVAIKTYCHDECQAGSGREEVASCQGDKAALGPCPVFPFRLGKNPNKSKPLSDERRAALVEAGKEYRFQTGQSPSFGSLESSETVQDIVSPISKKKGEV